MIDYEIYALTWNDAFKSFDLRYRFMLDKLNYSRDMILQELKKEFDEESRDTVDVFTEIAVSQ